MKHATAHAHAPTARRISPVKAVTQTPSVAPAPAFEALSPYQQVQRDQKASDDKAALAAAKAAR